MTFRDVLSALFYGKPHPKSAVRQHRFVEPGEPADPSVPDGQYNVGMSIGLHTLAGVFASNGWLLLRPGTSGPQPSARDIAGVLAEMIGVMAADPGPGFCQIARFAALQSEEFPNSIDLYVHIGTAERSDRDAPGAATAEGLAR